MDWNGTKAVLSQVYNDRKDPWKDVPPDLSNKVAIVTGANSGIGFETARGLCKTGMTVIMACRSEERANKAIELIKEEQPDAKVRFMNIDLTSLESIKGFVSKFKESESNLHILVNNAGVMLTPFSQTKDGFELQLGINHLGHFALTMLLLEILRRSGSPESYARIVTVSSVVALVGTINFDDLHSKKHYSPSTAYNQSKLANIMFTYAMQRRLTSEKWYITANCLHPGVVNTELFQYYPWAVRQPIAKLFFMTPEQGAYTSLYACLSPELEGKGGLYLDNCQESQSNEESYDQDVQEKLWDISCDLTVLNQWC